MKNEIDYFWDKINNAFAQSGKPEQRIEYASIIKSLELVLESGNKQALHALGYTYCFRGWSFQNNDDLRIAIKYLNESVIEDIEPEFSNYYMARLHWDLRQFEEAMMCIALSNSNAFNETVQINFKELETALELRLGDTTLMNEHLLKYVDFMKSLLEPDIIPPFYLLETIEYLVENNMTDTLDLDVIRKLDDAWPILNDKEFEKMIFPESN